jgi:hypothetical protein
MRLGIRKEDKRKFYLPDDCQPDGSKDKFYFEVRTMTRGEAQRALSEAVTQTYKQPKSLRNRKKREEDEDVSRKIRLDVVQNRQWGAALVGFVLPMIDGNKVHDSYKSKMSKEDMLEILEMVDEELASYIDTAIDVMQGVIPDKDKLEDLAEIGVTRELLGISQGDEEVAETYSDPTTSGEPA